SLPSAYALFVAPPPPAFFPLSLHDALPICRPSVIPARARASALIRPWVVVAGCVIVVFVSPRFAVIEITHPATTTHGRISAEARSEEHTSELQSRSDIVCRLLLEQKKTTHN